jgi:hypothetical protein
MNPRPLLHLEGAAVLAVSVFAYHSDHGSWGLFAFLFLMPDVSMVGYLANAQIGAVVYNAVHTYLGPLLLGAYSVSTDHRTPLLLALIWVAHIGLDRMLGFGLKYPTEFKDTHLGERRHAYILK